MSKPSALAVAYRLAPSMNKAIFSDGTGISLSLVIKTFAIHRRGDARKQAADHRYSETTAPARKRLVPPSRPLRKYQRIRAGPRFPALPNRAPKIRQDKNSCLRFGTYV